MAQTYTLKEATTSLRKLVERAASGEEMVITDGGLPKARLVPIERQQRRPGGWEGKVKMLDSFDDPLPESIQSLFEGHS